MLHVHVFKYLVSSVWGWGGMQKDVNAWVGWGVGVKSLKATVLSHFFKNIVFEYLGS